jgi:hypothetical protein
MANNATEAQIKFINSLKTQRDITTVESQTALNIARDMWAKDAFTREVASKVIDVLKAAPYAQKRSETPSDAPEGMHRVDGVIYKVQRSPESGRVYAKQLVQHGDDWKFEYRAGAIRNLSESTRMTLEEAKEFGQLYGSCCVCGRVLTNEESIEAGIGPVCSGKGGW